MAASPSHQFGQIVGLVLESAIGPPLEKTAKKHGFYLDSKRPRKARDGKKKVVWVDGQGNAHDLDFVIEEGGSEARIGVPKAFIEIAWRRYTKHSRNKAQEIQGALAPLAERYSDSHPFLGVVLAGDFTDGSLNQLLSHGFCILHFPYGCVVEAFSEAGIDASFDENTPDKQFARKVKQFKKLGEAAKGRLAEGLRASRKSELRAFIGALDGSLTRRIESVYVLPLHGALHTLKDAAEAIAFVESFDEFVQERPFVRFEIGVRYSNGDEVRGQFQDRKAAKTFLERFI